MNAWSKFGLTNEEKTMVYVEEEIDDLDDRTKFFLIGSLWYIRPFNNTAMINMMKTLRRPVEGVRCKIMGDNKFLFTLYCRVDVDSTQERWPWTFDNHILLLLYRIIWCT